MISAKLGLSATGMARPRPSIPPAFTQLRALWKTMFMQVDTCASFEFDIQYFIGFSHALSVVGVITNDEWIAVQKLSAEHDVAASEYDDFHRYEPR